MLSTFLIAVGAFLCCLVPLIIMLLLSFTFYRTRRDPEGDSMIKLTFRERLRQYWFAIQVPFATSRAIGIIPLIGALFTISLVREELSILSSFAIFLLVLLGAMLNLTGLLAIGLKIYSRVRKQQYAESSLGATEVVEGDDLKLNMVVKHPLPPGYNMQLKYKLPEKMGGELTAVSNRTSFTEVPFNITIPALSRGIYTIGPVEYYISDIFGLTMVPTLIPTKHKLVVFPEVPYISKFSIRSGSQGYEDNQTLSQINSDEYFNSRPYVPGDNPKFIHWKATAKMDRLITRTPESTTVSYSDLNIMILNVIPKIRLRKDLPSIQSRYLAATELALDNQVRIAASLIDFALRNSIKVNLFYFTKNSLESFIPSSDDPRGWKYKLAQIELVHTMKDYSLMLNTLSEETLAAVISSETDFTLVEELFEKVSSKTSTATFLYVPLSPYMSKLANVSRSQNSVGFFRWMVQKALFTKPYYEQTNIGEKLKELARRKSERYLERDIKESMEREEMILSYVRKFPIDIKYFDLPRSGNEADNISYIMENE